MQIVNLTPHVINIAKTDGSLLTVPPSGIVARVYATTHINGIIAGVYIQETEFGDLMPIDFRDGEIYVVSRIYADAYKATHPTDVIGISRLFTAGQALRDVTGSIVGCDGLCRA